MAELEESFSSLPHPPSDHGMLGAIVCRRASDRHEMIWSANLTPEEGLLGDKWAQRQPLRPETQVSVMRLDVAELVSNGQPISTAGDNLIVDLDLSYANLPPGTRLLVGDAILEVTGEPHMGCSLFRSRFGADALVFVNDVRRRSQNLRGIFCKVIDKGEAHVGCGVHVLSRPKPVKKVRRPLVGRRERK